jgi:hypothetical protein
MVSAMHGRNDPRIALRRTAVLWVSLATLMSLFTSPALAHHTTIGSAAGLPIPSLTHGQLSVIAENRSAILNLADQEPFVDETFYRLRNFIDLQYLYCMWGLVPGSLKDEASPFNECSHAYLSATHALLLHMRTMRGDQTRVRELIDKIEFQMLANNASLVLCRYSDEPFNTADVIRPRWSEVPSHLPSLLTFLALGIFTFYLSILAGRFLLSTGSHNSAQAGSPRPQAARSTEPSRV